MLSTETRLKLEDIAARIEGGLNVSFEEMTWAQKWADHNRSAAEMLRRARRRAMHGKPEKGTIDELIDVFDLGDPDPQSHLTGESTIDDFTNFFKRDKPDDWRTRD